MEKRKNNQISMPKDYIKCIVFHGHNCPGLVYGYLVAKEAIELLGLKRSRDEEIVAISENDSCAVDALQVILGTSIGKGNLIINDYGKNAYTIIKRAENKAYRFSRKDYYKYQGKHKKEFEMLEKALSAGSATIKEKMRQKQLKTADLLAKPFDEIFYTKEVEIDMPPHAPLARSKPCAKCGEMTMATKMVADNNDGYICIPCSNKTYRTSDK